MIPDSYAARLTGLGLSGPSLLDTNSDAPTNAEAITNSTTSGRYWASTGGLLGRWRASLVHAAGTAADRVLITRSARSRLVRFVRWAIRRNTNSMTRRRGL